MKKPALFLDRDGVIIHNVPYATDPSSVSLCEGVLDLLQRARELDFYLICVTNQSGIGRGWVTPEAYEAITARMNEHLMEGGHKLDRIYFAPYYENSTDLRWLEKPHWRKPNPGMIEQALLDFNIDLDRSLMVGDRATDIEAGHRGGVPRRILVASSEEPDEVKKVPTGIQFEYVPRLADIFLKK